MPNTNFLVFEGSNTNLHMNKMSVFRNGTEMPWSYYEADLQDVSQGRKYFMYTSKSDDKGPNGEKAGTYVSEITRWVPMSNTSGSTLIKQVKKNPSLDDYKSWGWPIKQDNEGKDIMPVFGEFAFKPNTFPDFEDCPEIQLKFTFGFGLNGTCYNFAEEAGCVLVYNLSCPPKLFCSNNKFCDIKYNESTDSWGPDMKESDKNNCLKCDVSEGQDVNGDPYNTYIYIAVESGEDVSFSFPAQSLGGGDECMRFHDESGLIEHTDASDSFCMSRPYRTNVNGPYDKIMRSALKFDFYRLRVTAEPNFRNKRYNKKPLKVVFKATPKKNDGEPLENFAVTFDYELCLTKKLLEPTFSYNSGEAETDDKFLELAFRGRRLDGAFKIRDDEAINYARVNNIPLPSELNNLSIADASKAVVRSRLTIAEKEIYDALNQFVNKDGTQVNEDVCEKFLHFALVGDKSTAITEEEANNVVSALDATLTGNPVAAMKTRLGNQYFGLGKPNKVPTIADIKSDNYEAKQFSQLCSIEYFKDPSAVNCVQSTDLSSLVNAPKVINLINYSVWCEKELGVSSYLSKKYSSADRDSSTGRAVPLSQDYHGVIFNSEKTDECVKLMGSSFNRPDGINLDDIKCKATPLDAACAINYICNTVSICENGKQLYGLSNTSANDVSFVTKSRVEEILYESGQFNVCPKDDGETLTVGHAISVFKATGVGSTSNTDIEKRPDHLNYNLFYNDDEDDEDLPDGCIGYFARFNEHMDASGHIIIGDASDGIYWNVCIDGEILKETPTNPNNKNNDDKRHKNHMSEEEKNNRNGMLSDDTTEYNILTTGIYQFVRIGNVIKFFVDGNDIDYEKGAVREMPEIEIKLKGDETGECSENYFPHLCLTDISSTLDLSLNYGRSGICEGITGDAKVLPSAEGDFDGIVVSRWGSVTIPVEVKGLLEKCECFCLSLSEDSCVGLQKELDGDNLGDVVENVKGTANMSATELANIMELPSDCKDLAFTLEYRYEQNGYANVWKPVGNTEFCYACHNVSDPATGEGRIPYTIDYDAVSNGFNSAGYNATSSSSAGREILADYTKSSNIEGLPSFRIKLSSQNKLIERFGSTSHNSDLTSFQSMFRTVNLNLEYKDGAGSETSENKTMEVNILVAKDDYNPAISYSTFDYNEYTSELLETSRTISEWDNRDQSDCSDAHFVALNTKVVGAEKGEKTQECVPTDELIRIKVDTSDISGDTGSWASRYNGNMNTLCACLPENLFDIENPIAEIKIPNFKHNGEYAAKVYIDHLWRYEKDEQEYISTKCFGLPFNNATNGDNDRGRNITDKECLPRLLPKNTNYGIVMMNNNTVARLYRKTPFNYEEWVGKQDDSTILNGKDFTLGDAKKYSQSEHEALRELVTIRIDYRVPGSIHEEQFENQLQTKWLNVFVKPKDKKEIKYETTHEFQVDECDEKVDIASIVSATLHGRTSDQIKYLVRGVVGDDGKPYFINDVSTQCGDLSQQKAADIKKQFGRTNDADNTVFMNGTALKNKISCNTNRLYTTLDDSTTVDSDSDLATKASVCMDLNDCLVDGKLCLYHLNYGDIDTEPNNTKFDAYANRQYGFIIEALYMGQDQSCIESCLSLVTVNVRQSKCGFSIEDKSCVTVIETRGTDDQTALGHNPEHAVQLFIDKAAHEDFASLYTGTELNKEIKIKVKSMDEELELCHIDNNILNSKIRLKDTEANKSTETTTTESAGSAQFVHYNYERKKEYRIEIEFSVDDKCELFATKMDNNYVCGLGTVTGTDSLRAISNAKTAEFLVDLSDTQNQGVDGCCLTNISDHSGLFYFQNPETGNYEGPLSRQPHTMEQLTQSRTLFNVEKVHYAFVRVTEIVGGVVVFTPLYKTPQALEREALGVELTKPPKCIDTCCLPFLIKVTNSYDKAKTIPQPYHLRDIECISYHYSDPVVEEALDNECIFVEEGKTHVCYVTTDHKELYGEGSSSMNDFANDKQNYLGEDITPKTRDISNALQMNHNSTRLCDPGFSRTRNKYAQNSINFGYIAANKAESVVVLDYFVEMHGCIDSSGANEIVDKKGKMFGELIDYSANRKTFKVPDDDCSGLLEEVEGSDKRLWRLGNICRARERDNDDADPYYTTAELKFSAGKKAEEDGVYEFHVATVTNVTATTNDISFNENMVDIQESVYKKLDGRVRAQPFQKYVYDTDCNAVVTLGYAMDIETTRGWDYDGADLLGSERFSKVLLVCRSKYKVCVKDKKIVKVDVDHILA